MFVGKIKGIFYHDYKPARIILSGHINNVGCVISFRVDKKEAEKLVNMVGLDRDEIAIQITRKDQDGK